MRSRFIKEEISYTGEQLHSLYALDNFGVLGDSIIAFLGPYDVPLKEVVDLENQKSGKRISFPKMTHFIAELFDVDLEKAILHQYLLLNIIKDLLNEKLGNLKIVRSGTDLYENDFKIGVSMATASPVSSLVYVGVNIIGTDNGIVKAKGLNDYKIDPMVFVPEVLDRYSKEVERINQMRCKIRWVE